MARMRRQQAFTRGVVRGGIVAFIVGMFALLAWLTWRFLQLGDSTLLQVWDGLLVIVRELGKAWRGQ
jgi:hypothetical protein